MPPRVTSPPPSKRASSQPPYQPRAENFVGGSKSYYQEWAEGVPAYCTPPPQAAHAQPSAGLEASLATLQTVYDSFAEEDIHDR